MCPLPYSEALRILAARTMACIPGTALTACLIERGQNIKPAMSCQSLLHFSVIGLQALQGSTCMLHYVGPHCLCGRVGVSMAGHTACHMQPLVLDCVADIRMHG